MQEDVTNKDASSELDLAGLFDFNESNESNETNNSEETETETVNTETISETDSELADTNDPDDELLEHFNDDESDPTANSDDVDDSKTFTVKIDGEEKRVTKEELLAQYQKSVAADRRFEEAATLRKEAEAIQQRYEAEANQLQDTLGHFTQVAKQWADNGLLTPPSKELLDSDPVRYLKEQAAFEDRLMEVNKAIEAQATLDQQYAQREQETLKNHVLKEQVKLTEVIPEWKNQDVRQKEQVELVNYLKNVGYTQDEIEGLSYSRAENIALARDAMLYRKLRDKAAASKTKIQPTKTIKSQPTKSDQSNNQTKHLMNQYQKTGDRDYALKIAGDLFT
jgi:hypothetical protein